MEIIFTGIVAALGFVFVVYPLFNPGRYAFRQDDLPGAGAEKKLSRLQQKIALVQENIADLDFEHEMGKLTGDDHAQLRAGLTKTADSIAGEIDEARTKQEIDEAIERKIRNKRKTT